MVLGHDRILSCALAASVGGPRAVLLVLAGFIPSGRILNFAVAGFRLS
jgi:hypothetical protein